MIEIETLAPTDIKNFLKQLAAAIELDQVRVDVLPQESFAPEYNDSMWRAWRRDHRRVIEELLSTADRIPPAMLSELTRLAITREPVLIGSAVLEFFAEVVCGACPRERLGTAERFIGWLTANLSNQPEGKPRHESARASILQWLPVIDPLRIAQDPECGYGVATLSLAEW
jgi:hypothetical protein